MVTLVRWYELRQSIRPGPVPRSAERSPAMALVPIDWQPDRTTLARFSEFALFFLGMVAAPAAYFRGRPALAAAFWLAAVAIRVTGAWAPLRLKPVYLGLTLATWPIGWGTSHLALGLLYYGVITPIALGFRLAGRDPLNRRFDRGATTYWEPYQPDRGMDRYLKQF